jgi:predicted TIM-barrel fold metal-dependent hydrolase
MRHGPVIDCDIHHELVSEEELFPYLSEGWREYVLGPEPHGHVPLLPGFPLVNPHGFDREDAIPPEGGPPGSSLELMREQLLDPFEIEHAVLTGGYGLYVSAVVNPYFASEVARALNDHLVERWLAADRRLKGSVSVANQIPTTAADEIRRLADHPQIVQAMLCANAIGHPFGHPLFDPIHRAAAETGLPLAIHSLGDGAAGSAASPTAGGRPSFYLEYHSGAVEGIMTHLMSFFFNGVFERYRDLRLVIVEGGFAWLPAFLRRLDTNWKGLRREVPWCKRAPSEYFAEHIKVTTQPLDIETPEDALVAPLTEMGFEDVLLFASDYPHWDADSLAQTRGRLPETWRERVLWRNASELYGLEVAVPT